ncbi:hypothetical protein D3C86_1436650 [compost metagenome]
MEILYCLSVQDQVFPALHNRERPFQVAENAAQQVILDQQQLFRIDWLLLHYLHFFIHFCYRLLTYFFACFCGNHHHCFLLVTDQATVNTIGKAFVLADISHQV